MAEPLLFIGVSFSQAQCQEAKGLFDRKKSIQPSSFCGDGFLFLRMYLSNTVLCTFKALENSVYLPNRKFQHKTIMRSRISQQGCLPFHWNGRKLQKKFFLLVENSFFSEEPPTMKL